MTYINDEVFEEAIIGLKKIVNIPTYLQENQDETPFGKAIQVGLEEAIALFKAIGMQTYIDPAGYYGYGEIGEGELFAVLCHIDVVPADNFDKWRFPPFEATIADDMIFGRGTQDNKGPSVASLFALKALLDKGYQLNKKVRFIVGADEENLWRCMDKYTDEQPVASMGFAPDSKFPLNYAEKGLLQFLYKSKQSQSWTLTGGKAPNVVPNLAFYQGEESDKVYQLAKEKQFEVAIEKDKVSLFGVAAHSKDAPDGVNAITRLAEVLSELYPENKILQFLGQEIGQDATGTSVLGTIEDEPSGHLTLNVSTIEMNASGTQICIDSRYPVTLKKAVLEAQLIELGKQHELAYEEFSYLAPLYVPLDSELTTQLMAAYQSVTGDSNSQPVASGGATYARTMPNCVAFGALFLTTNDTFHQINEHWSLSEMRLAMEVYAEAFKRLCFEA